MLYVRLSDHVCLIYHALVENIKQTYMHVPENYDIHSKGLSLPPTLFISYLSTTTYVVVCCTFISNDLVNPLVLSENDLHASVVPEILPVSMGVKSYVLSKLA